MPKGKVARAKPVAVKTNSQPISVPGPAEHHTLALFIAL